MCTRQEARSLIQNIAPEILKTAKRQLTSTESICVLRNALAATYRRKDGPDENVERTLTINVNYLFRGMNIKERRRLDILNFLEEKQLLTNVSRYGGRITFTLDLQPLRDWKPPVVPAEQPSHKETLANYMREYRARQKRERDEKVAFAECVMRLTGIKTTEEFQQRLSGLQSKGATI